MNISKEIRKRKEREKKVNAGGLARKKKYEGQGNKKKQ